MVTGHCLLLMRDTKGIHRGRNGDSGSSVSLGRQEVFDWLFYWPSQDTL